MTEEIKDVNSKIDDLEAAKRNTQVLTQLLALAGMNLLLLN